MDNDWKKRLGVVYSTNPDYQFDPGPGEEQGTISPAEQKLIVRLDKKNRKGKTVTLVEGFQGTGEALRTLGKELKSKCGAGGTAKDGQIMVQGDFRDQVFSMLKVKGYGVKRAGG
jgi:translation initiation factor 1